MATGNRADWHWKINEKGNTEVDDRVFKFNRDSDQICERCQFPVV